MKLIIISSFVKERRRELVALALLRPPSYRFVHIFGLIIPRAIRHDAIALGLGASPIPREG